MKKILLSLVALMAAMTSFAEVTLADLAGTYKGTAHKYGDDNVEASFTLTYANDALTLTSITFGDLTLSNLSIACTLNDGVLSISDYYYDYPYTSLDACKVEVVDKDNLKFINNGKDGAMGLYYMDEEYNEYSYWFNVGDAVSKGTPAEEVTLADLAGTYKGTGHKYGDDNVKASFTLTYANDALTLTSITFGDLTLSDLSIACALNDGVLSISDYYYDYPYTSLDACKAEVVDKDNLKFINNGKDGAMGLYYMDEEYNEYSYWFNVSDAVSKGAPTTISRINFSKESSSQKYNVAGQTVSNGYKGIVIMNGKKYIAK